MAVTRRPFTPTSFIDPNSVEALAALPVRAWDVVTASEFLSALGIEDKMLANRWLYRCAQGTPPFEPPKIWRTGRGAPRVIRKDRAIAWAATAGGDVPARACWPYAAKELEALGWPELSGPDAVQAVVSFLLREDIVQLATAPRELAHIDRLYV